MTEFRIPQDVYDAMNDPFEGFDKLYWGFVPDCSSNEKAFHKTVERMREFFPKWNRYSSYQSYLTTRNKRYRGRKN